MKVIYSTKYNASGRTGKCYNPSSVNLAAYNFLTGLPKIIITLIHKVAQYSKKLCVCAAVVSYHSAFIVNEYKYTVKVRFNPV